MAKSVKAWAGFTDGKLYRRYGTEQGEHTFEEYCTYKTRRQAKGYFQDVRRVRITEIPRKRRKK